MVGSKSFAERTTVEFGRHRHGVRARDRQRQVRPGGCAARASGDRDERCEAVARRPLVLARARRFAGRWAWPMSASSSTTKTGCFGRLEEVELSRRLFPLGRDQVPAHPPAHPPPTWWNCWTTPTSPTTPSSSSARAWSIRRWRYAPRSAGPPSRRPPHPQARPRRRKKAETELSEARTRTSSASAMCSPSYGHQARRLAAQAEQEEAGMAAGPGKPPSRSGRRAARLAAAEARAKSRPVTAQALAHVAP